MIDIDYDLIPLDPEQEQQVAEEARLLAQRGKVPAIAPTEYGRVVVVNPMTGVSIHHVPDDLRRPLRRVMLPVLDGSRPVAGKELVRRLLGDTEELLHVVVIEALEDFPTLDDFIGELGEVRKRWPACRFQFHGNMTRMRELLEGLLDDPPRVCTVRVHAHPKPITFNAKHLEAVSAALPRYPTFPTPFFTEIRVRLGRQVLPFTADSVRKLYPRYGVGNIEELDVSGKLRDRLLTVDLPLDIIESVRLREKLDEPYVAIHHQGKVVPARELGASGLAETNVPFSSIEAIVRRVPGEEDERIDLANVRALRINSAEQHVSFLTKPSASFIPLYEVTSLRVYVPAAKPDGDEAGAPEREVLTLESTVLTERERPRFGDIRAGVRGLYLERVYKETLVKQAKLKSYASGLHIACLGPLSAQTFKLLKPLGLGRFLPPTRHFYLSDTLDEAAGYQQLGARLRQKQRQLQATLRELFPPEASEFDADHVVHRLPMVLEWAHGEPAVADAAPAGQLESIYNELRGFIKFSEAEFRRVDHEGMDHDAFFGRLLRCREAAMFAKQLANVRSGAYGQLFEEEDAPDFVFFATEDDMGENGKSLFLPGMAWRDVLGSSARAELPWEGDYAFSVFLEEQLAIVESLWRQDGPDHPGVGYYDDYFNGRMQEEEKELGQLRSMASSGLEPGSQAFEAARARIEAEHKTELEQFTKEQQAQEQRLTKAEENYFKALAAVTQALGPAKIAPESLIDNEDYLAAMEDAVAERSKELLLRLRQAIAQAVKQLGSGLAKSRRTMRDYLAALAAVRGGFVPLQGARMALEAARRERDGRTEMLDRLNELTKLQGERVADAHENLHARRVAQKEEKTALDEEIQDLVAENDLAAGKLRGRINTALDNLERAQKERPAGLSALGILQKIEKSLELAARELGLIVSQAVDDQRETSGRARHLLQRGMENRLELYSTENELEVLDQRKEKSAFRRLVGRRVTEPAVPFDAGAGAADEPRLAEAFQKAEAAWEAAGRELMALADVGREVRAAKQPIVEYQNLQKASAQFRRAVRQRELAQRSNEAIRKHLERLNGDMADLPRLIAERLIPAYRRLCERFLVPLAEGRREDFRRARTFVQSAGSLSFENLQRQFLDRAVFRRFHAIQFRWGALYGQDPEHKLFGKLTNALAGVYKFHRTVRLNLRRFGLVEDQVELTKLELARPDAIKRMIDQQRELEPAKRYSYVVLPGTLWLPQALELIEYKDRVFQGLPQLVMMFISHFDDRTIQRDATLRQRYFRALKHNVILNISSVGMVDSPGHFASRLVEQTLGSSFDLDQVQTVTDTDGPIPTAAE